MKFATKFMSYFPPHFMVLLHYLAKTVDAVNVH